MFNDQSRQAAFDLYYELIDRPEVYANPELLAFFNALENLIR